MTLLLVIFCSLGLLAFTCRKVGEQAYRWRARGYRSQFGLVNICPAHVDQLKLFEIQQLSVFFRGTYPHRHPTCEVVTSKGAQEPRLKLKTQVEWCIRERGPGYELMLRPETPLDLTMLYSSINEVLEGLAALKNSA